MSLRTRLALFSGVAVAIVAAGTASAVYLVVDQRQRARVDAALASRLDRFLALPPERRRTLEARLAGAVPDEAAARLLSDAQLVRPDGTVDGPAAGSPVIPVTGGVARIAAGRDGARLVYETRVGGEHLRVMAVPAGDLGAAVAVRSLEDLDRTLRDLMVACLLVGAAGCLAGVGAGWLVARRGLRPLDVFAARLAAISRTQDLAVRLPEGGAGELARVAREHNRALAALEASVAAQRRLVADASHELRSPLAAIQANLQLLTGAEPWPRAERAAAARDAEQEARVLTGLVGDLIDLARDGDDALVEEDLRLDELVAELVRRRRRHAGGVALELVAHPVRVVADEAAVARAVDNLLDNAVKWSPPGGRVEVEVTAEGCVAVRDHGPGIDADDLPFIFDRFYRSRRARGVRGTGLGLAIVRRVADAHGARTAAETAPGGGARLTLDLGARVVAPSGRRAEPAGLGPQALPGAGRDHEDGLA